MRSLQPTACSHAGDLQSCLHVLLLALALGTGCSELAEVPAKENPAAAVPPRHAPFCLTTEFCPIPNEDGVMRCAFARELGRQAMLIAARDGLGLTTRDETLGESIPKSFDDSTAPFALRVRAHNDGNASLSLSELSADHDAAAPPVVCGRYEFQFQSDSYNMYTALAAALGSATRAELVDVLRTAGYSGSPVQVEPDGPLPEGVELHLAEMNFVSQYAAVRKIHAAIAQRGESPARLGGLVRGYAHLAMLTCHHWNSANVAFSARALLYAERLIALDGDPRLARQHRAYARALIGLHGMALQDLDRLPPNDPPADNPPPAPAWIKVIDPFCRFDEQQLLKLRDEPNLRQLVHQLAFEMESCYLNARWTAATGPAALKECPESYGIYSVVAIDAPMLAQRRAVQNAAETLGRQVPRRVARLDGLPDAAAELVRKETGLQNNWLRQAITGNWTSTAWSPLPSQIARALHEHGNDRGEPSWQVLAALIADEQFVEVANYLMVTTNAVEYSKKDLVDRFAPLIAGHPYAPYIQSYAVDRNRQPDEIAKLSDRVTVRDPRPNMQRMYNLFWANVDADGKTYSDMSTEALWQHDYRLPAMVASLRQVDDSWWQTPDLLPHFQRYVEDMQWISPHAPNTLRLRINTTVDPTAEQLADWEQQAQEDPLALSKIAQLHVKRRDFAAAIRCYDRAYTLSPSSATAIGLAAAYRSAGQEENWLPALEDYLQQEDYSLGHAEIHQTIAEDFFDKGKWSDAEPHALAAAQTWSAWGLILAGQVYEGLGRWDESEKWFREAVESYPSYCGYEWYFWCRRTGRGDVAEARTCFDEFLQLDWVQKAQQDENFMFVDDMLEERYEQALDRIQTSPEYANDTYWQTHVALLAKRLGNDTLYAESMDRLMQLTEEQFRESDPSFHAVISAMQELQRQGSLDDAAFAEIDQRLAGFAALARCNYCYFLGEQLAFHGHQDRAEKYWRRAVASVQHRKYNSTFAGQRLVEKHGTSRPDTAASEADDDAHESPADNSL